MTTENIQRILYRTKKKFVSKKKKLNSFYNLFFFFYRGSFDYYLFSKIIFKFSNYFAYVFSDFQLKLNK